MSKISPEELSKILKEHKRWCDTNEGEGKKADLSGADLQDADLQDANLTQVLGLNIEQLSKVVTLYKAELDPELKKQVKDKYPHLLIF
jgi:uncharacterized protein YjbI with pentapeptide repeats